MKKILIASLATLLAFSACTKQKEINPIEYLPEAKYDAMNGEIDSIQVIHYKDIEGKKSDIILLKASAIYDKNGYVTENRAQIFDEAGKILENTILKISRDQNSLPTSFSISQNDNEALFYQLNKRENNKEVYSSATTKTQQIKI